MFIISIVTFFCPQALQVVAKSFLPLEGPGMWLPPWMAGF